MRYILDVMTGGCLYRPSKLKSRKAAQKHLLTAGVTIVLTMGRDHWIHWIPYITISQHDCSVLQNKRIRRYNFSDLSGG